MIPVLVAALLAAATPSDTVFTSDGGRVVGTVLEESPSAGVTIQAPDGSVRRIPAAQVTRIEFSDGTVSDPRPAPAVAPAAAPAAAAAVPSGPPDTVYFTGSGRVRGTVIQEDPKTGVKLRLLDGTLRTYTPEEYTRIEYADGTVSRRKAEATPAVPPPASVEPAAKPHPAEALDTIFFLAGGRVRGTVIEENPTTGVRIRQLDGSLHTYSRDELVRIEYSDGTVSRRKTTPTPAPAPVSPPPPAQPIQVQPPPPSPPPPEEKSLVPIYLTLGAGVSWFGGDAEHNVPMSQVFLTQGHLSSELGLRLGPSWAIGAYGDIGGGDVAAPIRNQCLAQGLNCLGTTGRVGFLLRHTWDPFGSTSKWLSLGTGWEVGGVSADHMNGSTDLFTYSGREVARIGAGIDFRSNQVLGLGLYASFAWGEYDKFKDVNGASVPLDNRTHTTGQVGIRLTLFP